MISDNEFYNIINQYEDKIRYFYLSKVDKRDDIDDLVQESLYQIIKSLPNFGHKSNLSTWIYSICRNTLYNYYYQKRKINNIKIKQNYNSLNEEFEKIDFKIIIEKLEKPLNTIYDLYYKKNYKIKEIAELLDKPEGTIKYLLYNLKIKIREYYFDTTESAKNII